MMNSSDRWSSSSIPFTGLSIPEGTKTKNEEHGSGCRPNYWNSHMIYIYLARRHYGPDKHEIVKAEQWQVHLHLGRFGLFTASYVVPFITSYDEQFLNHLRDQHDIDLITGQ